MEIKNINDLKDFINEKKVLGDLYIVFDKEYEELKDVKYKMIEKLDSEEHRWYTIETNVYEFSLNGDVIGKLAIEEVGILKSESMDYEDCYIEVKAFNVKEVTKISYEVMQE